MSPRFDGRLVSTAPALVGHVPSMPACVAWDSTLSRRADGSQQRTKIIPRPSIL